MVQFDGGIQFPSKWYHYDPVRCIDASPMAICRFLFWVRPQLLLEPIFNIGRTTSRTSATSTTSTTSSTSTTSASSAIGEARFKSLFLF
jgi:hypothetical protein